MKIWAKLIKGDRQLRDVLFEDARLMTPSDYRVALQEICYALDIATPVSLPTHFKHLEKFNRVKYLPRDFIEEVDFTSLVLEAVVDK